MGDNPVEQREMAEDTEGSWLWYGGPGEWARITGVDETDLRADDGEPRVSIATTPIDSDILPNSVRAYAEQLYRMQPDVEYLILRPSDTGPTRTMLRKMWHIIKAAARSPVRRSTY